MKWIKLLALMLIMLMVGMCGWYFFATEINHHADQAATLIIQDTLASNNAFYAKKLLEVNHLIDLGNTQKASELVEQLIQMNIHSIEDCATETCNELKQQLNK